MKIVLTFILFFLSYSAYSQYSFRSSAVSAYTTISTDGDPVKVSEDDDGGATLSLPFTFTFNGTDYNSFGVSTNGYIAFDDIDDNTLYASSLTYDNSDFYLKTGIAILLQDLKRNSGEVYYKHIDAGAVNERVIIEWYNWGEYISGVALSGQFSMQMSLYKNGKITFLYDHPTIILNNTQFGIGLIFNNLSTGDDLFGVNRLSSNASSSSSNYGSTITTTIDPTIIPSVSGQYLFYEFYTSEPPSLNIISPLATLTLCSGSSSTTTTFGVSGSGLTESVTITVPSDFEISTSSVGDYSSSLTLTNTTNVSETIYVRLSHLAPVASTITGTINATSSGTTASTTVSGTILANPTLSTYAIIICKEATYLITKTTDMSLNGSWAVSGTITVNNGYVTAGTNAGNYVVSYTDGCATVSATVAVGDSDISPAITGEASYKINNTNPIPQGPTASLYVGYNGYNYFSATKPTNTGYYKANNIDTATATAGCPYPFYIFRCTTCPDPDVLRR